MHRDTWSVEWKGPCSLIRLNLFCWLYEKILAVCESMLHHWAQRNSPDLRKLISKPCHRSHAPTPSLHIIKNSSETSFTFLEGKRKQTVKNRVGARAGCACLKRGSTHNVLTCARSRTHTRTHGWVKIKRTVYSSLTYFITVIYITFANLNTSATESLTFQSQWSQRAALKVWTTDGCLNTGPCPACVYNTQWKWIVKLVTYT